MIDSPPGGWPIPQAVYVHVPFCRHRCGYCNFSVVANRDELADQYLTAIDQELAALNKPKINTLFVGGGTPTHLSIEQLDQFFATLRNRLEFTDDVEWSIEANPEDITGEKLELLVNHGVNRISLGVQSFNSDKLAILERGHSGSDARAIIEQVSQRIENLSIDLIFAAPGESLDTWQHDLKTALSLPIVHLSTYALTFEKGTMFWNRKRHGELNAADEALEVDMYNSVRDATRRVGLEHYEISNFARAGSRCRHNLAYWHGRGWYAVGPGAASFAGGYRNVNHRSTTTYLRRIAAGQSPIAESEPITSLQFARERAAFGIRMLDGINLDHLQVETGIDVRVECGEAIANSLGHDLVVESEGWLRLTPRGILFADTVASDLLSK